VLEFTVWGKKNEAFILAKEYFPVEAQILYKAPKICMGAGVRESKYPKGQEDNEDGKIPSLKSRKVMERFIVVGTKAKPPRPGTRHLRWKTRSQISLQCMKVEWGFFFRKRTLAV